ncbi:hypothetical protein GGE65_007960 [Skermanella aerolata]|uniref:hypothetical protein n=1 Tax=Skermanella aerolata TaxID=393310 RepID=UPI003D1D66BB
MVEPSALSSATSPPATPTAVVESALEVMLPDGARMRLEGAVDPTLAMAVLRAMAASGQSS